MWLRTSYGRLINCSHVTTFFFDELPNAEGRCIAVWAKVLGSPKPVAVSTHLEDTNAADEILDVIADALANESDHDRLCDLRELPEATVVNCRPDIALPNSGKR